MDIPESSVLRPGETPIRLIINEATVTSPAEHICDLDVFLQGVPPGARRLALALTIDQKDEKMKGVMIQSRTGGHDNVKGWVKFATWATEAVYHSNFPPVEQLDIKVL